MLNTLSKLTERLDLFRQGFYQKRRERNDNNNDNNNNSNNSWLKSLQFLKHFTHSILFNQPYEMNSYPVLKSRKLRFGVLEGMCPRKFSWDWNPSFLKTLNFTLCSTPSQSRAGIRTITFLTFKSMNSSISNFWKKPSLKFKSLPKFKY